MINISIDKNLDISIYSQIVNQITEAVKNDILRPGEKLPAQRELSSGLNIARGTIQKAYEELRKKGIIEILNGNGSFISKKQDIQISDRKNSAVNLIDELLSKLEDLNFTSYEIREFIDTRILEREDTKKDVRIAAIDCNPEALEIFRIQISNMKNTQFRMFILDEILNYSQPDKVFEDYDIIITTLNHYDQISGILYPIRGKLFKVAVSPEKDTIVKIATIPENSKIGAIVKSQKFKDIISIHLESFEIKKENVEYAFETDIKSIKRLINEKNILIIPQCYSLESEAFNKELKRFINKGGKIIEFKYQIERGSLIYIEEQIEKILHNRRN